MTINDNFNQNKEIDQFMKENNEQPNKYKVKEINAVRRQNKDILY